MEKLIITACICGAEVTKEHNPAVPYTVEEIAKEAKSAYDAGASIIHLHVREDDGTPTQSKERFEACINAIKEVCPDVIIYSALAGLGPFGVLSTTVEIMIDKFGANADMILFLCFLGILVILITKSGGARAYGEWASSKLKNRRSVLFATALLGIFFAIDDYFHCLAVGTIMRPVTDRTKISREKLAY